MLKLILAKKNRSYFAVIFWVGLVSMYSFSLCTIVIYTGNTEEFVFILMIVLLLLSLIIVVYSSTKINIYNNEQQLIVFEFNGYNRKCLIKKYLKNIFLASSMGCLVAIIVFVLNNKRIIGIIFNISLLLVISYLLIISLCLFIAYFVWKSNINKVTIGTYQKYVKKFKKSSLERWSIWDNLSYNFKWNYRDLRRTAIRSSTIVLTITIYMSLITFIFTTSYTFTLLIWELLLITSLFFILLLYNLCILASMERKHDIEIMKTLGLSSKEIYKILMTQIKWMTTRGIVLGLVVNFIFLINQNRSISIFLTITSIGMLLTLIILVAILSLFICTLAIRKIHYKS